MSVGDSEHAGGMGPGGRQRLVRMIGFGALVGALAFVLKVAMADDFDYAANWVWGFLILLGAVLGGAIGLILAGVGQSSPD